MEGYGFSCVTVRVELNLYTFAILFTRTVRTNQKLTKYLSWLLIMSVIMLQERYDHGDKVFPENMIKNMMYQVGIYI